MIAHGYNPRMRPLAVAAVLLIIGTAKAQNFPDSPQNMWVYDTQTEFTRCGL